MNENPEKEKMKTKPAETEESIPSQEESKSSEKAQKEKTETKEKFEKKVIDKLQDIEMGALFAGVENFFISAKKLDAKITMNADGLCSKVTGYLRNSINSYTRKKTK